MPPLWWAAGQDLNVKPCDTVYAVKGHMRVWKVYYYGKSDEKLRMQYAFLSNACRLFIGSFCRVSCGHGQMGFVLWRGNAFERGGHPGTWATHIMLRAQRCKQPPAAAANGSTRVNQGCKVEVVQRKKKKKEKKSPNKRKSWIAPKTAAVWILCVFAGLDITFLIHNWCGTLALYAENVRQCPQQCTVRMAGEHKLELFHASSILQSGPFASALRNVCISWKTSGSFLRRQCHSWSTCWERDFHRGSPVVSSTTGRRIRRRIRLWEAGALTRCIGPQHQASMWNGEHEARLPHVKIKCCAWMCFSFIGCHKRRAATDSCAPVFFSQRVTKGMRKMRAVAEKRSCRRPAVKISHASFFSF